MTSFLVGSCLFMTVSLISVFKRLWRKKKRESSVQFSAVGAGAGPIAPTESAPMATYGLKLTVTLSPLTLY